MAIDLPMQARLAVVAFENERMGVEEGAFDALTLDNTKLVWFSKVLENWKALVITNLPDQRYFEITYSGSKRETYIDAYEKVSNVVLPEFRIGVSGG